MNRLFKFEMKKICSGRGMAALIVIILLIVLCFLTSFVTSAYSYDESGNEITGMKAIAKEKNTVHALAGYMTEEYLTAVIDYNKKLKSDSANLSQSGELTTLAYVNYWRPYHSIDFLLSNAFSPSGQYDYKLIDRLSQRDAQVFYEQYAENIKVHIANEELNLSAAEQEFFAEQAQKASKPFYFDYTGGWKSMLVNWQTYIIFIVILMCVFIAPIFSREIQANTAPLIFSSRYGRSKVFKQKVIAAVVLSAAIYWVAVILFTLGTIALFGINGWNADLQVVSFASVYDMTLAEAYLIIALNSFFAYLLVMAVTLLVSVLAKSSFWSVVISVVVFFVPMLLPGGKLVSLFPINVMNGFAAIRGYNAYSIGNVVIPQHWFSMAVMLCGIAVVIFIAWIANKRRKSEATD